MEVQRHRHVCDILRLLYAFCKAFWYFHINYQNYIDGATCRACVASIQIKRHHARSLRVIRLSESLLLRSRSVAYLVEYIGRNCCLVCLGRRKLSMSL